MTERPSKLASTAPRVAGPVVLAIMDGVGLSPSLLGRHASRALGRAQGDAVLAAKAPFVQSLHKLPLAGQLRAHGLAVGLASDADMGNSEVGHNALGAGRIVQQGASRVAQAVADGSLVGGSTFGELVQHLGHTGGALHLLGLLSDGNVHSHIDHLIALIDGAAAAKLPRCYVHVLLDGRDVGRDSALLHVDKLERALAKHHAPPHAHYAIASGGGRMRITMDRYGADWPMVARGWATHVHGDASPFASCRAAIEASRANEPGIGDQDLPPFVVAASDGSPVGAMHDGDAVVLFNFRGDRMLQWVAALEDQHFAAFDRGRSPALYVVGMTLYDGDTHRPSRFLVAPPHIDATLGEALAQAGVRQLAVSETQKFGHVTYFFNGNRSGAFSPALEDYLEVPSLAVAFAEQPSMQADQIVDTVKQQLLAHAYGFVRINFANGDMVGHTGDFAATCAAIEAVDRALSELCRVVVAEHRGALLVTADHGNAEDMFERSADGHAPLLMADGTPVPKTAHSRHPVPFAAILPAALTDSFAPSPALMAGEAGLANVAATCAQLLGLPPHPLWHPSLLVAAEST